MGNVLILNGSCIVCPWRKSSQATKIINSATFKWKYVYKLRANGKPSNHMSQLAKCKIIKFTQPFYFEHLVVSTIMFNTAGKQWMYHVWVMYKCSVFTDKYCPLEAVLRHTYWFLWENLENNKYSASLNTVKKLKYAVSTTFP